MGWIPGGLGTPGFGWPAPVTPYVEPSPSPAPAPTPQPAPPPLPAAPSPIAPAQFAALLYGKYIPVGLASRATWGGRIIEGPVFTPIDGAMTASWISAFFLPMNFWSNTRTVTELLFHAKLAWSSTGGAALSDLNVGGATVGTEQRVRFNTGLLSQLPDAWSVGKYGPDAVAYIPLVTATFENIRLAQFGADNPVPFVSVTVEDTQFATPGDLVPWQDALETLARYSGRPTADFAAVDVTDGVEVPFILGSDITDIDLLKGLLKIKPQWNILTKDKLYVVEKSTFALDLILEREKVLKRGDDPITLHMADALDRPREEDYTFIDLDRDFEPSVVRCVEDLEPIISTGSVDIQTIDLPMATTANVAQAMANFAYYWREVAREKSEWSGRANYLGVEPGDTYKISSEEFPTYRIDRYHRINEVSRKADLTVDVKGEAFLTCAFQGEQEHISCLSLTPVSASTHTFAGQSLGAENDNRVIIVPLNIEAAGSGSLTITSVVIGGVTATIDVATSHPDQAVLSAICHAVVPTGTTGDIVITTNINMRSVSACVERIVTTTPTPVDTDEDEITNSGGAGTISVSIDVPAGGVIFAAGQGRTDGPSSPAFTGVDDACNSNVGGGVQVSGRYFATASHTGRAVSLHTTGVQAYTIAAASWTLT